MLRLPQTGAAAAVWSRLQAKGCLAIPHVLLHVPFTASSAQQQQQQQSAAHEHPRQLSGLLVVGSRCSSSQVVGLPRDLFTAEADDAQQQVLPILQSALVPSLAGAQAAAVYKDPSGV